MQAVYHSISDNSTQNYFRLAWPLLNEWNFSLRLWFSQNPISRSCPSHLVFKLGKNITNIDRRHFELPDRKDKRRETRLVWWEEQDFFNLPRHLQHPLDLFFRQQPKCVYWPTDAWVSCRQLPFLWDDWIWRRIENHKIEDDKGRQIKGDWFWFLGQIDEGEISERNMILLSISVLY